MPDFRPTPNTRPLAAAALAVALALPLLAPTARAAPLEGDKIDAPAKSQLTPAQQAVTSGMQAIGKGDLAAAEKAFRQAISLDPTVYQSYLGLAEVESRKGRAAEARQAIEAGLKALPNHTELLAAQGRVAAQAGQFPAAVDLLQRAIKADGRNVNAMVTLGDVYLAGLNKPDDAIAQFRAAQKADPKNLGSYVGMARALAAQQKFAEAIGEIDRGLKVDPKAALLYQMKGRLYAQQRDFKNAFDALSTAVKLAPGFLPALADRADVAAGLKRDDVAIADFLALRKALPEDPQLMVKLAMLYDRGNKDAEADKLYREAIKRKPDFAVAYNNVAWLNAKKRTNLDEALGFAKKAVELNPKVPQFQDTLGMVHRMRGDKAEALAAFEAATKLQPPLAEAFYHLGLAQQEGGRAADAKASFTRALEIAKDFDGADDARKQLAK